jgi:hypothetical protein
MVAASAGNGAIHRAAARAVRASTALRRIKGIPRATSAESPFQ